jgi:hypothetical protein
MESRHVLWGYMQLNRLRLKVRGGTLMLESEFMIQYIQRQPDSLRSSLTAIAREYSGAQAVRLSLASDLKGHHVYLIANAVSVRLCPAVCFGDASEGRD